LVKKPATSIFDIHSLQPICYPQASPDASPKPYPRFSFPKPQTNQAGLSPFSLTEISGPDSVATAESPVRIGALLTDLPVGPAGRWDNAAEIEIFLPGIALSSVSDAAIFAGENRFAIETPDGFEIIQAANAELIAASTYRLSRLLRGLSGTETTETIISGARIVWLGSGWQDLPLADDYIGETVRLNATAAGRDADPLDLDYQGRHLRPLAPVHPKIQRENGQVHISWVRQTRIGGDSWNGLDVPLGEAMEMYRVQFFVGESLIGEHQVSTPEITIADADFESADSLNLAQGSQAYGWGGDLISLLPPP